MGFRKSIKIKDAKVSHVIRDIRAVAESERVSNMDAAKATTKQAAQNAQSLVAINAAGP